MKVTLRQKPISKGRQSLYLDFYPPIVNPDTNRLTRRYFLDLYLFSETEINETIYKDSAGKSQKKVTEARDSKGELKRVRLTPLQKEHNKTTIALAESIRAQRQLDVQAGNYSFIKGNDKSDLIQYFETYAKDIEADAGNLSTTWNSALAHLKIYFGKTCPMSTIDGGRINGYRRYLLTKAGQLRCKRVHKPLSQNTAFVYFALLMAVLKQAYKDGILKTDIAGTSEPVKRKETHRKYLTIEELQQLANTPCEYADLKNASLFSALTGLRYSDIEKLKYEDIQHSEQTGYYIVYSQKKTEHAETLPISERAIEIIDYTKDKAGRVFNNLYYSTWQNDKLKEWLRSAGLSKDITFHSFRHTYATLLLANDVPIFTVSKMMGHKKVTTTQIYSNVLDKQKQLAANKISIDLKR